jgi:hypothetical protein
MRTLYQTTFVNRDGVRLMLGANQGRRMFADLDSAEMFLKDLLRNTGEERLSDIYGPQSIGTFRTDAFECYDNGDAVSIYPRRP